MTSVRYDMLNSFFGAVQNRNYDVCSRWAVARRTMQDGSAYSIPHYPYVEGILNSRAHKNWIMKAAQVGLTEAGITLALFVADYEGRDVIYYFPTKKMGERFSKTRFSPAINLSDYLRTACTNNTMETKQFGNATIHVLGAGSEADLLGTSASRLIFDELDRWTDQQIYMAEERAAGTKKGDNVIMWGFSTPRFPNCGIHKQFLKSTMEHFFFECPHSDKCGWIDLIWDDEHKIQVGDGIDFGSFMLYGSSLDDPTTVQSYLKCRKCGGRLEHDDKMYWLENGQWMSKDDHGEPTEPDPHLFEMSRGFYLPQLYSPSDEVGPAVIAQKFLRGYGDEAGRREFHNSCIGRPYIEDSYQVTDTHIDAAIEQHGQYSMQDITPTIVDNSYVTLGIDQGGPIHHWAAVAWTFDKTLTGDPNDRASGKLIGCGRILQDDWAQVHQLMHDYQVRMCVIDGLPQPTNARTFARSNAEYVYISYYNTAKSTFREIVLTEDEYGASQVKSDGVGWMSKTLGRLINGTLSLPLDLPMSFRQQVKAPVRTMTKVGGQIVAQFVETGPDHYAHALCFTEIALKIKDPSLHQSPILTKVG